MNNIDFNTQPDGFPLESDATLGFLQSNLISAINALSKLSGQDMIVINGLVETGNNVSDGWILLNNELLFFEGGVKSEFFIIDQQVTQKANENGNIVDRYFVRKAIFGTAATQYAYADLERIPDLRELAFTTNAALNQGIGSPFTITSGLQPINDGVGGVSSGIFVYNGRRIIVQAYPLAISDLNPVYLSKDGEWSTTTTGDDEIVFRPYGEDRLNPSLAITYPAKTRNASTKRGDIRWVKTSQLETEFFDATGRGEFYWLNWALANGNNGTIDLTSAIAGLTAIERIN